MIRSTTLALLASACFAVDGWERIDPTMGSIGIAVHTATSTSVSIGPEEKEWTEATRGEVYFRSYYPTSQGVQPFFEGALFNDVQNYSNYDGRIDCDTFGLGLSFGAAVSPMPPGNRVSLGIMPYVRFAFGSSDVYIRDMEYDGDYLDADGSIGRFDFGGGADVRLTLGRHIEAAVGGGINFWKAANIDAVVTDRFGAVVRVGESVDFSGHDVFLRASFGFSF